jgi:DinB family protein
MQPMKFIDSPYHALLENDLPLIKGGVAHLPAHFSESLAFLQTIPAARLGHAYAPGKWTIAQLIGHLSDTQTVFLNRILYIARGQDVAHYPFDEQIWVGSGGHDGLGRDALLGLYASGSAHCQAVIESLPAGSLERQGLANQLEITVEEIALYLMAHEKHHLKVIRERYLV